MNKIFRMNDLAPIVLFVYNRPWHTRQTVEALKQNRSAEGSDLVIYSDYAKNSQMEGQVKQVRNYIKNITGFKSVKIIERTKNWGLADSIIDGVTAVVNEYGRVIVLEDDIVTSSCFLKYMNEALIFYQDIPRVMHISGYIPPINNDGLSQTFLIRPTSCWGWGTWKRKWDCFDNNIEGVVNRFTEDLKTKFNINNSYDYFSHIDANQKGKLKTWAIFWYASVFFADGLSLHPSKSLVCNIGHDFSGVHCKQNSKFQTEPSESVVSSFVEFIEEDALATQKLEDFYNTFKKPFYKRVLDKVLSR